MVVVAVVVDVVEVVVVELVVELVVLIGMFKVVVEAIPAIRVEVDIRTSMLVVVIVVVVPSRHLRLTEPVPVAVVPGNMLQSA